MPDQFVARGATTFGTPTNADNIYVLGGSASITANVNWSTVAGIGIFEINKEFSGVIASSAAPFKGEVDTRLVYEAQAGSMYFDSDGSITDATALVQVIGGGHFTFQGAGTITRLEIGSGQLTIAATAVVTTLRVGGGTTRMLDDTSTDPTTVEVYAGFIETERGATTLTHIGGTTIVKHNTTGPNAFTTVNVHGPGLKIIECGTITTLNCLGGVPDLSELSRPVTVTNSNVNMKLPGAKELLRHSKLTFTNATTTLIHDGRQ